MPAAPISPHHAHLSRDKKLATILRRTDLAPGKRRQVYLQLCNSIIGQQLSTKVAEVIRKRFIALFDGKPSPEKILATDPAVLRSIGLSNAKVSYIRNVAEFTLLSPLEHRSLARMDNEAVIAHLTTIKGVGRWTVEMLMMFTLGREDVFAVDDLGIQNAMIALYKLDKTDRKKLKADMLRISARWSPYRTYACLHLWRYKDNVPVS